MIIEKRETGLIEVILAKLKPEGHGAGRERYFSTSEQLLEYVRRHPDMRFHIGAEKLGANLSKDPSDVAYGVAFGDVFCGHIEYVSTRKLFINVDDLGVRDFGG